MAKKHQRTSTQSAAPATQQGAGPEHWSVAHSNSDRLLALAAQQTLGNKEPSLKEDAVAAWGGANDLDSAQSLVDIATGGNGDSMLPKAANKAAMVQTVLGLPGQAMNIANADNLEDGYDKSTDLASSVLGLVPNPLTQTAGLAMSLTKNGNPDTDGIAEKGTSIYNAIAGDNDVGPAWFRDLRSLTGHGVAMPAMVGLSAMEGGKSLLKGGVNAVKSIFNLFSHIDTSPSDGPIDNMNIGGMQDF